MSSNKFKNDDTPVIYTGENENKEIFLSAMSSKKISNVSHLNEANSDKLTSFINDSTKSGLFPIVYEINDDFVLLRIKENVCDEIDTNDEIKIQALCFEGENLVYSSLYIKTHDIKKIKSTVFFCSVNNDTEVIKKARESDTKYYCASCGKKAKKMKHCSHCKVSYYCNKTCKKKNRKIHKKICAFLVS